MDYEYIDISASCNAGMECLPGENPVLGEQKMRGLPFTVGSPSDNPRDNCYISLSESDSSITVPISKKARKRGFRASADGD